jgi:hypothetical protein
MSVASAELVEAARQGRLNHLEHRIFQYCRPCAGRRRRQRRSRGGTNCRSDFTKEPEAARPGGAGSYSPWTCCRRVPAAVSPGSIRQPVVLPVAGSGSVHCRTGHRTAMATTNRRWKRHTSGACVHRVQQHSGRVAATMQRAVGIGAVRSKSGREGFTALAILPAALPAGVIMVRCGRHWCRNICIGAGAGMHYAHGLR